MAISPVGGSVGSIVPPGVSPNAAEALRLRKQLDAVHAQLKSGAGLPAQRKVDLLNAYMDAIRRLHPRVRCPAVKTAPPAGGNAPNVCVTPAQPAPIPVPYPNVSSSSAAASNLDATHQKIKSSPNDSPEHTSGLVSNYVKGACEYMMYSFDVKFEGKNLTRLGDPLFHNNKNSS